MTAVLRPFFREAALAIISSFGSYRQRGERERKRERERERDRDRGREKEMDRGRKRRREEGRDGGISESVGGREERMRRIRQRFDREGGC